MTSEARPLRTIDALDVFRVVAMASMVQGHVFTAITEPGLRASLWGGYHDFVHGQTAPMFSFASGLVFGTTTLRALARGGLAREALIRRFERYATLIFLGYLMHVRAPSLAVLLSTPAHLAASWLVVDALQCIGVTLCVAQTLAATATSARGFLASIAALLAVVVLGAPFLDGTPLDPLPLPIAAYLNGTTGSLFPLFPWAGYVLAGILSSQVFLDAQEGSDTPAVRLVAVGLLSLVGAVVGTKLAPGWLAGESYWTSSPWLFVGRAGASILFLALLLLLVPRLTGGAMRRGLPILRIVAAESLVVYVVHIAILYGTPVTASLRRPFQQSADVETSTAVAVSLFVGTVLVAIGWHRFKEGLPMLSTRLRRGSIGAILLRFVLPV